MHHVVVVHHQHAQVALGLTRPRRRPRAGASPGARAIASPSGPNSTNPPRWRASTAASRRPIPVPGCCAPRRRCEPRARTCPRELHVHVTQRGARVLARVSQRLGEHGLGDRLERRRQLHVLGSSAPPAAGPCGRTGARARRAAWRRCRCRRRQRTRQRVAQVPERGLHLVGAAASRLLAEAVLGPERQRDAEQALHHALVDLAREVDAAWSCRECPCGFVAMRRWPPAPRSCRASPSWRSSAVSSKLLAAAVGEDHARARDRLRTGGCT